MVKLEELGTVPDPILGRKYGVSRQWIAFLRKRHHIQSYTRTANEVEIPKEDLETMNVRDLVKKYGMSFKNVQTQRKKHGIVSNRHVSPVSKIIDDMVAAGTLSEFSDDEIAKIYKVNKYTVQRHRLRAGVKRR